MADNYAADAASSNEKQPPAPDEVAQMMIDQQGDHYALSVAAEIRRLADLDAEDDDEEDEEDEEEDQPSDVRRGYNVPADSASMRGYISARGAA